MEMLGVIIVFGVFYWLWTAYNGSSANKSAPQRTATIQFKIYASRKEAMEDAHPLSAHGSFDQEVVGESHYQGMLSKIVASIPSGHDFVQATLEMEPNNPYDKNAVAVKIAGQLVGYLPKAAAKEYRKLAKAESIPAITVCPAIIRGSPDTSYGVWLGIPELA
jgi:hypothetical protein